MNLRPGSLDPTTPPAPSLREAIEAVPRNDLEASLRGDDRVVDLTDHGPGGLSETLAVLRQPRQPNRLHR